MSPEPYRVAVIGGDGIGPEVTEAAVAVLKATGIAFSFHEYDGGDGCLARTGVALPDETLQGALDAQAVLFGAAGDTAADVILRLRRELGTYVNLRPSRAFKGVDCLYPDTNIVIVRENTECLYAGIESEVAPGVVTATRVITQAASDRIARFAFEYARANGRSKVTAVHKANVLRRSDGRFLASVRDVAREYPDIAYDEGLVDAVAMHLVMKTRAFEVIVTTNLFGDILSDLCAGLIGGLGLCPSANLGDEHALFEPVHGTAPDIAGKGIANPTAAILCGAMLLRNFGELRKAQSMETALADAIAAGQTTPDLGGTLSTMAMAQAVIDRI
jgi:3-isopropylmalate dehydrogenase